MEPVPFHLERSSQVLTGQAGVALVGRALERFASVSQHIDPNFPVRAARERLIQSRATHLHQLTDKLRESRVQRIIRRDRAAYKRAMNGLGSPL